MSEQRIQQLLESRLLTWAEDQGLRVAIPNVDFTPPMDGSIYLQEFLLPALPDSEFLEGTHTAYIGVYQVNVCAPNNQGTGPAGVIVDALRALFPNQLSLTDGNGFDVSVNSPLAVSQGFPDGARWITPVSFQYRADTTS